MQTSQREETLLLLLTYLHPGSEHPWGGVCRQDTPGGRGRSGTSHREPGSWPEMALAQDLLPVLGKVPHFGFSLFSPRDALWQPRELPPLLGDSQEGPERGPAAPVLEADAGSFPGEPHSCRAQAGAALGPTHG